jgi:hypothetical protein
MKLSDLIALGDATAESFRAYDDALTALDDSFGIPLRTNKTTLLEDIRLAQSDGMDLSSLAGPKSRFKFPEHGAKIVVRYIRKVPSHPKTEKLEAKVAKLERELKLAKQQLKHKQEELVTAGEAEDVVTDVQLAISNL